MLFRFFIISVEISYDIFILYLQRRPHEYLPMCHNQLFRFIMQNFMTIDYLFIFYGTMLIIFL